MADWTIDQEMDRWLDEMDEPPEPEDGFYNDFSMYGGAFRSPHRRQIKCQGCGSWQVYWRRTDTGWMLYENYKPHECPPVDGEEYLCLTPAKSTGRKSTK